MIDRGLLIATAERKPLLTNDKPSSVSQEGKSGFHNSIAEEIVVMVIICVTLNSLRVCAANLVLLVHQQSAA